MSSPNNYPNRLVKQLNVVAKSIRPPVFSTPVSKQTPNCCLAGYNDRDGSLRSHTLISDCEKKALESPISNFSNSNSELVKPCLSWW